MAGYDENFLQVRVPLPGFSRDLKPNVFENAVLHNGHFAEHVNYTVAINKSKRSPLFAALNIDQNKAQDTKRKDNWKFDPLIDSVFQLGKQYYDNINGQENPYDKGHLAMAEAAAWGASKNEAQISTDATNLYSNATLQHKNFNRDEWLGLETWVLDLSLDIDGKISCLSGPIYGSISRSVPVAGMLSGEVPAAFFKIVCFVNNSTGELDVRAFIAFQDSEALLDMKGRRKYNFQQYQSTVREIEDQTGLRFAKEIAAKNPLLYTDTRARRKAYRISHFPERIEVDRPEEIIDGKNKRTIDAEDKIDIYIAAAMVKPADRQKQWISINNLDNKSYNLSNWNLEIIPPSAKPSTAWDDIKVGRLLPKNKRTINPGESVKVEPKSPLKLDPAGGTIVLYDPKGRQIDRVKYLKKDVKPGIPVALIEY